MSSFRSLAVVHKGARISSHRVLAYCMLCPIGTRLTNDLTDKVRQMMQSDANMKNPNITLRIRGEEWRTSTVKVAEARTKLSQHRSDCAVCTDEG
jgi:hypothetical protein